MIEKTAEIEKSYYNNLEEMVFPILEFLRTTKLDERQAATLDILDGNLQTIFSPFLRLLHAEEYGLTQREIQIAQMILLAVLQTLG